MATLACGFGPTWFLRRASAQAQGKRVLVVVFQRGAVDGLNMVVPYVEGRDLSVTTDFRTVAGEILQRHLGSSDLAAIFPGFPYEPLGLIG